MKFGLDDKFRVRLLCVFCGNVFQAMETEIDDLRCENESNLAIVSQLRQVSVSFVFPYYESSAFELSAKCNSESRPESVAVCLRLCVDQNLHSSECDCV